MFDTTTEANTLVYRGAIQGWWCGRQGDGNDGDGGSDQANGTGRDEMGSDKAAQTLLPWSEEGDVEAEGRRLKKGKASRTREERRGGRRGEPRLTERRLALVRMTSGDMGLYFGGATKTAG